VRDKWLLLAGDGSALPPIASVLEATPAHVNVMVFASLHDASDLQMLPAARCATCNWTDRGDAALIEDIRTTSVPASASEVWAAGEAHFVRALRRHWILDLGVNKHAVDCTGDWKLGAQDYRNTDSPDLERLTKLCHRQTAIVRLAMREKRKINQHCTVEAAQTVTASRQAITQRWTPAAG
jgi:hypothetical protein